MVPQGLVGWVLGLTVVAAAAESSARVAVHYLRVQQHLQVVSVVSAPTQVLPVAVSGFATDVVLC